MIKIDELDARHAYSVMLREGGAIVGTLVFPMMDGSSEKSLGGFRITHSRTIPTVRRGNLHLFTLDVGIGVYEVLIPLDRIQGIYRLGQIDEPIVKSSREPIWQEIDHRQTWSIPFGRLLVDKSTEIIKDRKFKFRPAVELPSVHSLPHPFSWPIYMQFKPEDWQVIYVDHDLMARYFGHFASDKALLQIFRNHELLQVSEPEDTTLHFTEGAISFFSPPQLFTWRGQAVELVAITSKPFSEGDLGDDWILGCVRDGCFSLFRECVERLGCTYHICGEWRKMGVFETEYGSRNNVLFLGAGIYFDEKIKSGEQDTKPFQIGKYRAVGEALAMTGQDIQKPIVTEIGEYHAVRNTMARLYREIRGSYEILHSGSRRAIKILFLAANPSDKPRLRLDEEIQAIDQVLHQAEFRNRFEIEQHWAVRVTDLQSCLLRHRPDIVHFSGHGSTSSEIILQHDSGISHPVSAQALSSLFSVLNDTVRCVVLNAGYSEKQAQAIAEHIDCVIGMSKAISDSSAISFMRAFYQALGYGRDIKTAFDLGCNQIELENPGEQHTPKLFALKNKSKETVFASMVRLI